MKSKIITIKMIFTLLKGYCFKNIKKFLIMIFAIAVSTTIIFGTTVARKSQSKYTMDEIYRQSPSYQVDFANMSQKDLNTVEGDENVKSCVDKKFYGQIIYNKKGYFLESFNKSYFEKSKHTLVEGRFPQNKNEIIIEDDLFKELKSNKNINSTNLKSQEYDVDFRYIKEYVNSNKEQEILDKSQKFKIVGIYKMTDMMKQASEGDGVYVNNDFEYPKEAISYSGFIDLKSGTSNVQRRIDELSLKLDNGEINMRPNRVITMAKEENQEALSSFNLFDTGTIIASACIIFNVFNIMMKEIIRELGLLRVVGMSKKQSLIILLLKNLLILLVGSMIGFFGGYLLAQGMISHFELTGVSIDTSKAPIYISSKIIGKTLKITISILFVSTIIPIITTLKSYPINMMFGKVKSPFDALDEIFIKLKVYRKIKSFILNIYKKLLKYYKNIKLIISNVGKKVIKIKKTKDSISKINMKINIAINNSKRNKVYILTTAIIVGMAGVYGVKKSITSYDKTNIGNTLIQNLGDYDIDVRYTGYTGNSRYEKAGIHNDDIEKISSIKGVKDIYTFTSDAGYTNLNTSDLSKYYKENLSIKDECKEFEGRFDVIGLNKEALHDIEKKHEGIIESGRIYDKNSEVLEAVVYNNFFDQEYSGYQQTFNEKYKLGDILKFKVPVEIDGKLQYKTIDIKIVGFLSKEWFAVGTYTHSKVPDVLVDANEYAKITGNPSFKQVKIKADEAKLDSVKAQVKDLFKNREDIKYNDKETITTENGELAWQAVVRDVSNCAMLSITAIINIIFSIVTSITIRKKEFGVMRSIGLSIKDLKGILLIEGFIYGLACSMVGFLFIFYKGIKWAHLLRMTAKYQNVPYEGTWYILPKVPILIFVLITMVMCLLSVTFTFGKLNKDSIVEQIKED